MAGTRALSKMQFAPEVTPGTAVTADEIWRGPFGGLQDARATNMVEEDMGIAMPSSRRYTSQLMAEWAPPATPFTPEQSPHIFEAGIKAVGTGAADGDSPSTFTYSYPFPISALNTIRTYTLQTGDEEQAEEAEYMFVKSFTITATEGEAVEISAEWAGRRVQDATFDAGAAIPSVSEILSNNGVLYIDDTSGAFGTTPVSAGNIKEASLNVTTGWTALFTIDSGNLYFHGIYFNKDAFEASLELKWIHAADAVAERSNWRNDVARLVRLEFTGDAVADTGTTGVFTHKTLRIDFPGVWDEFTPVEHEDGLSIVTATLVGGYENLSGEGLELLVANEVASLI